MFKVTYTDGNDDIVHAGHQRLGTPQNHAGETKAVMAYRLNSSGAKQNMTFWVYGYTLTLNSAKQVKSITLPANRNVIVLK